MTRLTTLYYPTAQDWREAPAKRVLLFAMSGLGKTHTSNMLREDGDWFHYSIDYRIGTRYMGERIADNFKREAMKVPALRELLLTNSIYIASNITFDNLSPLSNYLGKPGNPDKGGLPIEEYRERQAQHHEAEVAALLDTPRFIDRAVDLYGYRNFICDSGGSICEVVDPDYRQNPVLSRLSHAMLLVWIEGSEDHTAELIRRFDRAPKPMCYQAQFLSNSWSTYLVEKDLDEAKVDPDDFIRWTYARAMAHRTPRYKAMAEKWGMTVQAREIEQVRTPADFEDLIARALERSA
jgi:hypothetical protein